jgi:beta-glucosidase
MVEVTVTNNGPVSGKDVVQLYLEDIVCSVPRPRIELKGFAKVSLEPGESTRVAFAITRRHLSFYDEASRSWVVEDGEFIAHVGNSPENLPLRQSFVWASQ